MTIRRRGLTERPDEATFACVSCSGKENGYNNAGEHFKTVKSLWIVEEYMGYIYDRTYSASLSKERERQKESTKKSKKFGDHMHVASETSKPGKSNIIFDALSALASEVSWVRMDKSAPGSSSFNADPTY